MTLVLGFDPGTVHTAYALLDTASPRPSLCAYGVLYDAECLADLDRAVNEAIVRACDSLPCGRLPDLVAVEAVGRVFPKRGFGTNMATDLVSTTRIERDIIHAARARGIPTTTVTLREWRCALVGKRRGRRGTPTEADVRRVLAVRLADLPRRMTDGGHVCDAAGVALHCAERYRLEAMIAASRPTGRSV